MDLYEIPRHNACQIFDLTGKPDRRLHRDHVDLLIVAVEIDNVPVWNLAVIAVRPVLKHRIVPIVQAQRLIDRIADILRTDRLDEEINRMNFEKFQRITASGRNIGDADVLIFQLAANLPANLSMAITCVV